MLLQNYWKRIQEDDVDAMRKKMKFNVSYTGGALENTLTDYRINLENELQDADMILDLLKDSVMQLHNTIDEELCKKKALKFYLSLHANFHLGSDESFQTDPPIVFNTDPFEIYESTEVDGILTQTYEKLFSSIEEFQHRGSGWVLDKLLRIDIHILEFNPLRATSYIPLPTQLARKKAVINIKNKDEKCFLWSVIAGTYMKDSNLRNQQRPHQYYMYGKEFNLRNIDFPMKLPDIPKFR